MSPTIYLMMPVDSVLLDYGAVTIKFFFLISSVISNYKEPTITSFRITV